MIGEMGKYCTFPPLLRRIARIERPFAKNIKSIESETRITVSKKVQKSLNLGQ